MCVRGKELLYDYVVRHGIPYKRIGKMVVCTSDNQLDDLSRLLVRASENGVADCSLLTAQQCKKLEPSVHAVAGLLSPSSGILDSHRLMEVMRSEVEQAGSDVICNAEVLKIKPANHGRLLVQAADTVSGESVLVSGQKVINCSGLHAHVVASRVESFPGHRIPRIWFAKGNYFSLHGQAPFSRLIYPMPGDGGLGVHLTLDLSGQARFGPDVEWLDHSNPENIDYTVSACRKQSFVESVQCYWPSLPSHSLHPDYSGVRPKLSGPGAQSKDFMVQSADSHGVPGLINVFGVESPGLTASLGLGEFIVRNCLT